MLTEAARALRPALVLLLLLAGITGLLYPVLIAGVAQVALPHQANGSMVMLGERRVGSELIGQGFADARYFRPRPSAAGENGFDASASAATNLAPGSKDLYDAIAARVAEARADGLGAAVPADLVTTSGSGLDPHLSPAAALAQVPRVARARGLSEARVRALVQERTEYPLLGFIGEPRVNVLLLNLALDAVATGRQPGGIAPSPSP
jgi:K+-transporting ATPase ATPase C chain